MATTYTLKQLKEWEKKLQHDVDDYAKAKTATINALNLSESDEERAPLEKRLSNMRASERDPRHPANRLYALRKYRKQHHGVWR